MHFIPFIVDYNSFNGKLITVLFSELQKNDIAVVETAGLDNDSISKLLTFNLNFLRLNPRKLIITIDFVVVNSQKAWITIIDGEKSFEEILFTIPLSIRRLDKYPFNLRQK